MDYYKNVLSNYSEEKKQLQTVPIVFHCKKHIVYFSSPKYNGNAMSCYMYYKIIGWGEKFKQYLPAPSLKNKRDIVGELKIPVT